MPRITCGWVVVVLTARPPITQPFAQVREGRGGGHQHSYNPKEMVRFAKERNPHLDYPARNHTIDSRHTIHIIYEDKLVL